MGEPAVKSHAQGKKHQSTIQGSQTSSSIKQFFTVKDQHQVNQVKNCPACNHHQENKRVKCSSLFQGKINTQLKLDGL